MLYTLLLAAFLALSGVGTVAADMPAGSRAASLEQCVEETGYMRRYHMEVLFHQRDRTMREGIRTRDHSLVECVSCHAGTDGQGNFVSVNADGQFCAGCHKKAAVTIDCFQCHAPRPDPGSPGGAQPALSPTGSAAGDLYTLSTD